MIKVFVKKQGNFPVSSPKIKRSLSKFFLGQGIVSDADVNILIVGKNEMERLGGKYLSKDEPIHNVLTFVANEATNNFIDPPDEILHLGDIAVCFPIAVKEAGEDGVLVEEKVIELLTHGAYHLLGIHHE
jgi:probable rRNA maturation factor